MIQNTIFLKVPFNEVFTWKSKTFQKLSKLGAQCKSTRATFVFSGHERVIIEIEETEEETEESIWNFYLQQASASSNNIYSTTSADPDDDDIIFP